MSKSANLKAYPKTPELDKMKAVQEKSQAIGEFVDIFLAEKGFYIGRPHEHKNCAGWETYRGKIRRTPETTNDCALETGEFENIGVPIDKLLAEFFGIDLVKCENERRAILDHIRGEQ